MGSRPTKLSRGAPSRGNRRAGNDGDLVSPSASESSSSKAQAAPQVLCTEVVVVHITPTENEIYILVPAEEMEGERRQGNIEKHSEMPTIAMSPGSSEAVAEVFGEANVAPELSDATTETLVMSDSQPSELDFLHEPCQLLLPEGSPPSPPPKTYEASFPAELSSDCPAVSEEEVATELASIGMLSVRMAEPQKGTEDLHPSSDLPKGTEGPGSHQKISCKMDLELTKDDARGAAEEQAMGQREPDEATSQESLQRRAELHPHLILAETPARASAIMVALVKEPLAEGRIDSQNNCPLSGSETKKEIPEERSAVGSWKEREDFCSSNDLSFETEPRPNDHKIPCRICLEISPENTQVAAEEPSTMQRQLDGETTPEKAADIESHLNSVFVEISGGASNTGTAQGMKELAKTWSSIPGHDLPLSETEMEGKVSRDGSEAENMTKPVSCQLKMWLVEAQDKMLVQGEVGDETEHPIPSNNPLEKEVEHTMTTQNLRTVEERPNNNVQLLGNAELFAQSDEAGQPLEAILLKAHTFVPDQPPAEVTMVQSSPKALLGTAETVKELQEAHPTEETKEQAGSPKAQLPPETGPVSGTSLWVAHGEEEAEFFDATDTCMAAEVLDGTRILEAPEKHDGKDDH